MKKLDAWRPERAKFYNDSLPEHWSLSCCSRNALEKIRMLERRDACGSLAQYSAKWNAGRVSVGGRLMLGRCGVLFPVAFLEIMPAWVRIYAAIPLISHFPLLVFSFLLPLFPTLLLLPLFPLGFLLSLFSIFVCFRSLSFSNNNKVCVPKRFSTNENWLFFELRKKRKKLKKYYGPSRKTSSVLNVKKATPFSGIF